MPHDTALIVTLAAGLGLAFVFGWLATRVGLPALVGYLLAGVAVGPFSPGFTADIGLAGQLAEVGVILLMFGVGLHFSVRDLLNVRRVVVPGALAGMLTLALAGTALASLWGWPLGQAITFGLCICISSTVVVIRSFEQRGALDTGAGKVAVGWMVVEDLVMVLALVLLPALAPLMGGTVEAAATTTPLWLTLTITLAKVVAFSALMYVVGRRAIPWFLWQVARTGSRELFTLSVLAAALGIAVGAAVAFGVSFALGAFFAGLVISESDLSHQAAADALPLRDAFAVLFFVSVGMLFDPAILLRKPLEVVAIVALVMILKPVVSALVLLRLRKPARSAVQVGASLGEIGEFSFILAGLGISLGLLDVEGRSLILAAALLSISFNPLLARITPRLEEWLASRDQFMDAIQLTAEIPIALTSAMHLRGHAIIVGYGRVGSLIGRALESSRVGYAVVEQDRQMVDRLRERGHCAIYGDAARPGILEQAAPDRARLLVVATPDPFQARRVVELARQFNPQIDIVVRTHSSGEQAYFERIGVGRVIMGELELALGMAHYAICSLGFGDDAADTVVERIRAEGAGEREARDVAGIQPD